MNTYVYVGSMPLIAFDELGLIGSFIAQIRVCEEVNAASDRWEESINGERDRELWREKQAHDRYNERCEVENGCVRDILECQNNNPHNTAEDINDIFNRAIKNRSRNPIRPFTSLCEFLGATRNPVPKKILFLRN